jgi:hypothetical protein
MARRCRLTSFFRIFVIIPIWIVLGTVSGGAWGWAGGTARGQHGAPALNGGVRGERGSDQVRIKERLGDQAGMASSYAQLGILAQIDGTMTKQPRRYHASLATFGRKSRPV